MKSTLQKLYHYFIPEKLRWSISRFQTNIKYRVQLNKAVDFLINSENVEYKQVGLFLRKNGLQMFPYPFAKEYNPSKVNVYYDNQKGMHFVLINDKKMYLKKGMLLSKIKTLVNSLLIEQDHNSPHVYLTETFDIDEDSVIYDVGTAEGIFTLWNIEKVRKAYLFETDESWIEALNATFEPYKDKITIVNKFVGNEDSLTKNLIRLDTFAEDNLEPNFIKADIEGAEIAMLKGSEKILKSKNNLKLSVCTYHNESDAQRIQQILEDQGLVAHFSDGFMFCYNVPIAAPYLRKGLIRATK